MTKATKIFSLVIVAVMICSLLSGCKGGTEKSGEINVGQYKGLSFSISEDDVERQIKSEMSGFKKTKKVTDRAAQKGDIVKVSYSGTIDGLSFVGSSGVAENIEIGQGKLLNGADKQLIGTQLEETVSVTVTYPEGYEDDITLSGKTVVYQIKLLTLKEDIYPELTDAFVKENFGFDTIEAFRENAKLKCISADEILNRLIEESEVKSISQNAIKAKKEKFKAYYTDYAENYYECGFEDFLKNVVKMTDDEWDGIAEKYAKNEIKKELIVNYIADAEKIKVSEAEYDEGLNYYLNYYGYKGRADKFLEDFGEENFNDLLLMEKVVAFVNKNAEISVKGAE